ncbi:MAG: peptidoglycan DD-metalloendopeptidase family protein [Saprospiraceae bacterium]
MKLTRYKKCLLRFLPAISGWTRASICSLFVICIILLATTFAAAQDTKALEQKRKKVLEEIKITNKKLELTKKNKDATLEQFHTLQTQVSQREELVRTISSQVNSVAGEVSKTQQIVDSLQARLDQMKVEYAGVIRKAYRIQLGSSEWMYLFSAQNFNQALQRWRYLNQITRYRKKQSAEIIEAQQNLSGKLTELKGQKSKKEVLLKEEKDQKLVLQENLKEKDKVLSGLKADEKKFALQLRRNEETQQKLANEIQRVIRDEIARKEKEAKKRAAEEAAKMKKEEAARKKKEADEKALADKLAKAEADKANKGTGDSKPATIKKETPKPVVKKPEPVPPKPAPIILVESPAEKALSNDFKANRGKLPWPVAKGAISRGFGNQPHPTIKNITVSSTGLDFRTEINSPVRSIFKGKVMAKKYIPGLQNMVIIQHGSYYSVYCNLSSVSVVIGQEIDTRQNIGSVGSSEDGQGEVHFEIWQDKQIQNPMGWISK